jgi:FMN-dependent oxidoreductase (nitrilotriacetate monooxygenase family)
MNPMIFNFFLMNCPSHIFHGSWRHPDSRSLEHTSLNLWTDLAKLAEKGGMDAIFIADNFGIYEEPGDRIDRVVANAIQFPCTDPTVLISAMAAVTEHLGFAYTSSTLQQHPSPFARAAATLDHATRGRIGWNVVTSFVRNAARSVGIEDSWSHDERYRWAEEYVDVTYKLWEGSWDDGAVLADKAKGIYADPSKVHKINHVGERFRVEGPLMAPPSPQRTPVLFQAGTSPAGQAFAAKNAEGIFLISGSAKGAGKAASSIRAKAVEFGRRPDDIIFLEGMSFVVGSTEEDALRKEKELEEYLNAEAGLIMSAAALGIDPGKYTPDTRLIDIIEDAVGLRSGFDMVMHSSGKGEGATLADFVRFSSRSWRKVGTPEMICDEIAKYQAQGIDGINIMYMILPGTYEDFIEHVVPELRKRGMMKTEYRPGTFREKLFPGSDSKLNERHPAAAYRGAFTPKA